MDTVSEIHERHEAVRDLEKKLLDLQQVLNQFDALRCTDLIKISTYKFRAILVVPKKS